MDMQHTFINLLKFSAVYNGKVRGISSSLFKKVHNMSRVGARQSKKENLRGIHFSVLLLVIPRGF